MSTTTLGVVPATPAPRWLDAEEQAVWLGLLAAVQRTAGRLEEQLQRDSGLAHADYELLVRLSAAPDRRMRMSALADSALFSRSRASHAVARLERSGWVRREACAEDGRGSVAVLLAPGLAALAAAAPGHVETVRSLLFDPLSPTQVRQLGRLLAAIDV